MIIASTLIFIIEGVYVMHFLAFDLTVKVHPEPEKEEKNTKRINQKTLENRMGSSGKGYFWYFLSWFPFL